MSKLLTPPAHDALGQIDLSAHPAAQVAAPTAMREKVDYIEYFRAVAIMIIVAGHAFDLAWLRATAENTVTSYTLLNVLSALFNGGTFYFVFISGFLYHHVFHGRVPFRMMMRKKALYVGLPYLILGSLLAIVQMYLNDFHVLIDKRGELLGQNLYADFMVQMVTGQMMTAYWYIPFIFLVFLASPLFDRFIALSGRGQALVFLAFLAVALIIHRPQEELNPVHLFLYYVHAYLLGIMACEWRKTLLPIITKPTLIILSGLTMLSVAVYQFQIAHNVAMVERFWTDGYFMPKEFDWMLIQKIAGVIFLTGLLARFGHFAARPFAFLAANSFGIYFMHGIVLTLLTHMPHSLSPHTGSDIVDFFLYAAMAFIGALAIVLMIKEVAGEKSRYIVGS